MARNTFASVPPLHPIKPASLANASRKCSSLPARVKFSKRFTASVADHTPSPLAGKRVFITRAESQSATLAAALRAQGAEVVSLPLIQILPPLDCVPLDSALRSLRTFDWLVFTSQTPVTAAAERLAVLDIAGLTLSTRSQDSVMPSQARTAAPPSGFREENLSWSADLANPGSLHIAAVGKATAAAAQVAGFNVTVVGQGGTAAALV